MNFDESPNTEGASQRIAKLRDLVRSSFPSEKFEGKVTPSDCEWTPETDDEHILYQVLKGQRWTDVRGQFIYDHPKEIVLLTDEAFAAFLPAWLERALEDGDSENTVRDYIVYTFGPREGFVPHSLEWKVRHLRILSPQQQLTVRSLMDEFAKSDPSSFIRALAAKAVTFIDEVMDAPVGTSWELRGT